MFLCDEKKFVYVDIPKTGSRSMLEYLKNHFTGIGGMSHVLSIPLEYESYYKYAVVRNPYDRMCSYYWYLCKRSIDVVEYRREFKLRRMNNTLSNFLDVLNDRWKNYLDGEVGLQALHAIPQYAYVEANNFDKIIRFENMEEEFNELPFIDNATLPHINRTAVDDGKGRPHWKEMIDDESIQKINEMFGKEFELFGYEKK